MTEKKKITQAVHLQARGLFALAQGHYRKAIEAETVLAELLGYEDSYCGCLSDQIFDGDFDLGMKREGFAVIPVRKKRT